ncbi:hypothetical protein M8C21_024101 [Ambrosia artemisiifolia]|uniref:Uncharacterized protein n=1 Tax=Ambrosia artemisiifolia TaxID=4212 RepID=A0AAD5CUI4_AMBAR|nr:hypothetical protein M8C21_024101 [Ambrosia artemisiifolia]
MPSSPNSSVKSSSTTMDEDDDDTCHTPCRRDTNCTCSICQASINATLDLLPLSAQRSTLTKLSSSKPSPPETPRFFDPSTVSTPLSDTSCLVASPPVNEKIRTHLKFNRKKTGFGYGLMTVKCVVIVLCFSLVGKFGFEFIKSSVIRTELSPDIVRKLGEKSLGFEVLKDKLGFLNHELQGVVGAAAASFTVPNWELVQDGLMLRSRCRLYKSGMEEVSVWGWSLQTSGKVSTDFGSRSFTVLSGRVTEVSNGESSGLIRTANASWEQGKWSDSVWHLDENTWILEYERSFVFEDTRPFLAVMEFFGFKMMKSFEWMKQLWTVSDSNHLAPT